MFMFSSSTRFIPIFSITLFSSSSYFSYYKIHLPYFSIQLIYFLILLCHYSFSIFCFINFIFHTRVSSLSICLNIASTSSISMIKIISHKQGNLVELVAYLKVLSVSPIILFNLHTTCKVTNT